MTGPGLCFIGLAVRPYFYNDKRQSEKAETENSGKDIRVCSNEEFRT